MAYLGCKVFEKNLLSHPYNHENLPYLNWNILTKKMGKQLKKLKKKELKKFYSILTAKLLFLDFS